jgi:RHS repeat-associated protein
MAFDDGPRIEAPGIGERPSTPPAPADASPTDTFLISPPSLSLPKGGGAIRGLGEKFAANPVTGAGSMTVPIATSPGRAGFGPKLSLTYDSAAGNGPFGFGWSLALPAITVQTEKGLPLYRLAEESDVYILSGAEDLVPSLVAQPGGTWVAEPVPPRQVGNATYEIKRYRPRVEGLFARIERWTNLADATDVFWRSISKDNVTTWYGRSDESRIRDPADKRRIFSWLICESYDDKANVVSYRYKAEDGANLDLTRAHEQNRSAATRGTQRFLKHIYYGNQTPYLPAFDGEAWPSPPNEWFFEVVLDYGEHDSQAPTPTDDLTTSWNPRSDPFSSYRPGFELRTYRLCRRVLMFHRFPPVQGFDAVPGFETSCLVRSTDFTYSSPDPSQLPDAQRPIFSFLQSVKQVGYKRAPGGAGYTPRSLPPVELTYTQPMVDETVRDVDAESLENLPVGLDGSGYQWVDLEGEGLSGILTEQAGAWFYKRNLAPINLVREYPQDEERALAKFAPIEIVGPRPNAVLGAGDARLTDLSGDGRLDLVMFDGPLAGFYEQTEDGGWNDFRPFAARLNRTTTDPNLRFIDLDGDGHPDVLITENDVLTWHRSLDVDGFGPAQQVFQEHDEEKGPALVFADGTQSIYLADMSGDGLTDLVRIRNGEVCYWPNMGYGRFGAKVTMDRAPWFDAVDMFDERRILIADIDGSGTADLIYLHAEGPRLYFNQSGNSWSRARPLGSFPTADGVSGITAVDLLGNGTACLVWSSPLPDRAGRQMRYVDLMGGQKPHLLVKTRNNLGGETTVDYAPSTKFYLLDERAGTPWVTRLPFPVQVVERVTVTDDWRRTSLATLYAYHHGYYDGFEREFRGFGRLDTIDTLDLGKSTAANADSPFVANQRELYQPPVKTVTWFHTGAFLDRDRILSQFAHEYFPGSRGGTTPFPQRELPEPDLEAQALSADEWREALRACKGMPLRQEIFELDVDALTRGEERPVKLFSAAQHACHIRRIQPAADNRHAVFLVTESEAVTYHYELDLTANDDPDPRIAHTLNLRFDPYGRVEQSVAAVYPRVGTTIPAGLAGAATLIARVQSEPHLSYTETRFTDDDFVDDLDVHRIPLVCEVSTYELTGLREATGAPAGGAPNVDYLSISELAGYQLGDRWPGVGLHPVPFREYQNIEDRTLGKRIVERVRTRYFDDHDPQKAPTQALPLGKHGPRGLKYEDYKLALTDTLLTDVFQRRGPQNAAVDLLQLELVTNGGPLRELLDQPDVSGYVRGDKIDLTAVAGEPAPAAQYWMASGVAGFVPKDPARFFVPTLYTDPFSNETTFTFDGRNLYIQSALDARKNRIEVTDYDYRVLAPIEMLDQSKNYARLAFDILGMPVASAIMGKNRTESGDSVDGIDPDIPISEIVDFLTRPYTATTPLGWLGTATARFAYDLGEQTDANGNVVGWGQRPAGAIQIMRERHGGPTTAALPIQVAVAYSDGGGAPILKKSQAEPDPKLPGSTVLRWIKSGRMVFNNKGNPVKQYEPDFSAWEHQFDATEAATEVGVTPVMYYDGPGRLVRTDLPDGTFSRVAFSPWHVESFDPNDTVLDSAWYRARGPIDPAGAAPAAADKRAAWLAARSAGTPAVTVLDSLGREVIAVAHNRVEDPAGTLTFDGRPWKDERYVTFTKLDAEGKPLWIRDALGHLVMQYLTPTKATDAPDDGLPPTAVPTYDIAGNLLYQHSMDAGDRWMLTDAAGKPMLAWDFYGAEDAPGAPIEQRLYATDYDELHRPTALWLRRDAAPRIQVERFEYQDALASDPDNLNGQAVRHYDPSGLAETVRRDFKGNVLTAQRTLTAAARVSVVDWQTLLNPDGSSKVAGETFTQLTDYDALSRMTLQYNWHLTDAYVPAYRPRYNARGVLTRETLLIGAQVGPAGPTGGVNAGNPDAIQEIRYNAKGQKELLKLGNGTTTSYEYDKQTFRLTRILTRRQPPPNEGCSSAFVDPSVIQDLQYTYDPVGNITELLDAAQAVRYGHNSRIDPVSRYEYDPLYRLTLARGRESRSNDGAPSNEEGKTPEAPCPAPDPAALRLYAQRYTYDPVGNIQRMRHTADGSAGWTRDYSYAYESAALPVSNRLHQTTTDIPGVVTTHTYDTHGSMLNLANTPAAYNLQSDHRDMIARINLGGGGTAYYQYDAGKQRTRKFIENQNLKGGYWERIYLGGYELYRRYNGAGTKPIEVIETHHLFAGDQRVLVVDDVQTPYHPAHPRPDGLIVTLQTLFRYQYTNHLGSGCLEADNRASLISHEEYHPYGTSAHRATRGGVEAAPSRYRYTGMERDEESGLNYHTARYYAQWLGRWVSSDPVDRGNRYEYGRSSPLRYIDRNGRENADLALQLLTRAVPFAGAAATNGLWLYWIQFASAPAAVASASTAAAAAVPATTAATSTLAPAAAVAPASTAAAAAIPATTAAPATLAPVEVVGTGATIALLPLALGAGFVALSLYGLSKSNDRRQQLIRDLASGKAKRIQDDYQLPAHQPLGTPTGVVGDLPNERDNKQAPAEHDTPRSAPAAEGGVEGGIDPAASDDESRVLGPTRKPVKTKTEHDLSVAVSKAQLAFIRKVSKAGLPVLRVDLDRELEQGTGSDIPHVDDADHFVHVFEHVIATRPELNTPTVKRAFNKYQNAKKALESYYELNPHRLRSWAPQDARVHETPPRRR